MQLTTVWVVRCSRDLARGEVTDLPAASPPVQMAIDDRPVDRLDPFLRRKTTIRDVYQAAARHPGADDVILWNQDREVTETTIGNLAVRLDGEWVTPPVSSGSLEQIFG